MPRVACTASSCIPAQSSRQSARCGARFSTVAHTAGEQDAPVEHGVERRDLVDTHGRHLEQLRDIIHDADARPSLVLPLAEVEERDYGGLLVLWWVSADDFLGTFEVVWVEFEGNLRSVSLHDQAHVQENVPWGCCRWYPGARAWA